MNIVLIFLVFLGTIFQSPAMFKTGGSYDFGVGYWGPLARDGVWHEALSRQLSVSLPPQNPGFAGETLANYHYFYDLLVAKTSFLTGVSIPFLIYRFYPILFSVLLGFGTYKLSLALFKSKFTSLLAVFFVYFGSSFGWIVSLIKREPVGGESTFWANQPVSMNLNPPFAISLVLIVFILILLNSYLKKPGTFKGIILGVAAGTLIGFKAYAGIVVLAALFLLTVKKIFFDKSFVVLPVFLVSAILTLAIYFYTSRGAVSLLTFQPFWLVDTMIDAGDRVGIVSFTARRFAYLGSHKWLKLIVLESISFLIFILGNLGTRLVAFWGLGKKNLKFDLHLFVLFMMAASFVPPFVFVQKGNAWNIVQFFYYFVFFSSLYAAYALEKIYKKLPRFISAVIIGAILIVTPISSAATFRSWLYPRPPAYLGKGEYEGLKFLERQNYGTVLRHPFDEKLRSKFKDPYPLAVYADSAYVSAFSAKPVFIEDVEQQIVLNTNYKSRLSDAERFFKEKDLLWSKKFLKEQAIAYIYLPKIYQLPVAEQGYPMVKIFENKEVNIYKVIQ